MSLFPTGRPQTLEQAIAATGTRAPAGLVTRGAGLNFEVELIDVLATLGYLPPAMIGALVYRIFDLLDHHRRLVLKNVALDFPGRRRAQRMIAATIHRYSNMRATRLQEVYGEGFAASRRELFRDGVLRNLQFGADITAARPMALPFLPKEQGNERDRKADRFKKLLAMGLLKMGQDGLLFEDAKAANVKPGEPANGPVGRITITRRQRKLLKYYEMFTDATTKAMPIFERDIGRAMTVAGRAALEEAARRRIALRTAHARAKKAGSLEFHRYISMNPGDFTEARRVAKAAERAVRQELLGRKR